MPSVSVVIPVLDDGDLLRLCLAALQRQTRQPDAIIVVDNGCTDDSAAIARQFGARVVIEPVKGVLSATAAGFDRVDTEIIARIDADSRPDPDWLEAVLAHFDADIDLAAVTGPGDFYEASRLRNLLGRRLYLGGYFRWVGLLLGHPPLFGSNFAIRTDVWKVIRADLHRGWRWLHDDLDISYRLGPDHRVVFDGSLVMPISPRPFDSIRGLARRVGWGFRTIWINSREPGALARRRAIITARRSGVR